jgi:hypothetical protein
MGQDPRMAPWASHKGWCTHIDAKKFVDTNFFAQNSAYGQRVDVPNFAQNLGNSLFGPHVALP